MILRLLSFAAWISVTGLLSHAAYRIGASGSAPKLARLEQDLAEARAKAGAGCGTVYMAAWPDYACSMMLKAAPAALKPFLCESYTAVYRQPDMGRVQAKLDALGPGTPGLTLYEERGAAEKRIPFGWKSERR